MNFSKEIANIGAILAEGLEAQRFGSFSARNPQLGRMKLCPLCRRRRREFSAIPCCNTAHATSQRAWTPEQGFHQEDCPARVTEMITKGMIRKMLHKRHGQNRDWHRRQMTARMQEDFHLVEKAAREMHVKVPELPDSSPDLAAIPVFAEKYWLWRERQQAKRKRKLNGKH